MREMPLQMTGADERDPAVDDSADEKDAAADYSAYKRYAAADDRRRGERCRSK